jgi:hypothetical protein
MSIDYSSVKNHKSDPMQPRSDGITGLSRGAGDATDSVKQAVINEIINQGRNTFHLGNADIANLLAIAKLESGFNPDAAAASIRKKDDPSGPETSASGIFQVTDSTAADAAKRLSNTTLDSHVTLGTFNRFDYKSNIQYGIAIYLDKKRVANSSDVFNIYKAWNSNPNEYNKYQTSLRNDDQIYASQLNSSTPTPGQTSPAATDTFNGDKVYVYAPQGYLTLTQELQLQPNIMDPVVLESIGIDSFLQEWQNTTRTVQNSDGSVSVQYVGTGGTINVDRGTITTDPNSQVTINGSNDVVNGGSNSNITFGGNGATNGAGQDTVNISGGTVTVLDNTNANIIGDNNNVNSAGSNSYFGVYGGNNHTTAQSGDSVWTGGIGSDNAASTVNANGANVVVTESSTVTVNSASSISVRSSDYVTEYGDNTHVSVSGDGNTLYLTGKTVDTTVTGNNDTTLVHGDSNSTVNRGNGDVTDNYGVGDVTSDYGSYDHTFNYGGYDYTYSSNGTDTIYNEYPSDSGGGYGSYGYGGYEGGYIDHYYAGTVAKPKEGSGSTGINIDALLQFDKAHGHNADAKQVAMAWAQVESAIANNSAVVTSGAIWNHETVTWCLAQVGGQFSGKMGAAEEQAIKKAFDQWSTATGLRFQEVSSSAQADIKFGWGDFDTAESGVVGLTGVHEKSDKIAKAIVRLENPLDDKLVTNANGEKVYAGTDASFDQVLLHEIGHALGFGDNVDPSSIENYSLTQANRTLSASDMTAAASLYGLGSKHAASTQTVGLASDGLVQAMSSFAPVQMANAVAANDVDDFNRHIYGAPAKNAAG